MRVQRFTGICAAVIALCIISAGARGAQIMKGTLLSNPASSRLLRLALEDMVIVITPADGAKIMRGQIDKEIAPAALSDFAPGDHIVAVVDQYDHAISLKAFYGRIQGTFTKTAGRSIVFEDGRVVPLSESAQIVLPDGKFGTASDISAGSLVVCRTNPVSGEAWTVVATGAAPEVNVTEEQPIREDPAPKQPVQRNAEITSVTYSAPDPLKPGDVLTVDLSGTPGAKATFMVKGLFPSIPMEEVSPGSYRAVAEIPGGKSVRRTPLIGRLVYGGSEARPVQASRLVTVVPGTVAAASAKTPPELSLPSVVPVTKLALISPSTPVKAFPAIPQEPGADASSQCSQPADTQPPETDAADAGGGSSTGSIVITDPPNGAKIRKAILIRGKADPDSKVQITITYSNGLTGLLKLSGQAASQLVAVGKNGEFGMGPIPLEGPLATDGLSFTIKAYYSEHSDHATAMVEVTGDRY